MKEKIKKAKDKIQSILSAVDPNWIVGGIGILILLLILLLANI